MKIAEPNEGRANDVRVCVCLHTGYLGEDRGTWTQYDATELLKSYTGPQLPILIDQVRVCVCVMVILLSQYASTFPAVIDVYIASLGPQRLCAMPQ